MRPTPTYTNAAELRPSPLDRAQWAAAGTRDWLDARGRWAWLAAIFVAFVVAWPLGLGLPRLLGGLVESVEQGTTAAHVDTIALALAGFLIAQTVLTRFARYLSQVLGEQVLADAVAVAEAGAFAVVLEKLPAELGARISGEIAGISSVEMWPRVELSTRTPACSSRSARSRERKYGLTMSRSARATRRPRR